jgi:spermidine synthase
MQWVPTPSAFEYELVIRTFLEAFPHATLWRTGDILIGSPNPLRVDRAELQQRLARPELQESLVAAGFTRVDDVLAQFRADGPELRAYVGPGPILDDDKPIFEYFRGQHIASVPPDLTEFSRDPSKLAGAR